MTINNREPSSDEDRNITFRHWETVVVGLMTAATIALVGMFGILEIAGDTQAKQVSGDPVEEVATIADVAVPMLGAAAVALYVVCLVAGSDVVLHTFRNRRRAAARQYYLSITMFQLMIILVGIVAALTIIVRAIAN